MNILNVLEQLSKEENNSTGMAAEATTIVGQTRTHGTSDNDDPSSKTPSVTSQVPKPPETTVSSLPLVPPQHCVSPTHPPSSSCNPLSITSQTAKAPQSTVSSSPSDPPEHINSAHPPCSSSSISTVVQSSITTKPAIAESTPARTLLFQQPALPDPPEGK